MNKQDFITEKGILKKYVGTEKELVLPLEIKKIGCYAFTNQKELTSIRFSERLKEIGTFAMSGCENLREIEIPPNVTKIENGAFHSCTSLQKITVAKDHPVFYSKNDCLMEISTKKLIAGCQNSEIPEETTELAPYAFAGCKKLLHAEIPNGTVSIGESAFLRCSGLKKITIPSTVRHIGKSAFERCLKLTEIQLPPEIKSIEDSTFSMCASLSALRIPDGVEKIGYAAFSFCTKLKKIQIPESVSEIGYLSFTHCSALPHLILPKKMEFLGTISENLPIIGVSLLLPALSEEMQLQAALGYATAVSRNLAPYPQEYRKIYLYVLQQNKNRLLDYNKANDEILSVLRDEKPIALNEVHEILRTIMERRSVETIS